MPKAQLIVKLLDYTLVSNFEGVSPRAYCNIMNVNFFQGSCILIFVTESSMLILEFKSNELFSVHVERLNWMEKTSLFLVNHLHSGISTLVNDTNNILICLGTIYHEPLEIEICYIFFQNSYIQLLPKYTLGFRVFKLHIANNNRHYFVIDRVIDMASHSHLALNTFDMIKPPPGCIRFTKWTPHAIRKNVICNWSLWIIYSCKWHLWLKTYLVTNDKSPSTHSCKRTMILYTTKICVHWSYTCV
jgi:hypothetical protein